MKTVTILVSSIDVPAKWKRKINDDNVNELAESIRERGLLAPLVVRAQDGRYQLIAGMHRLKAVIKLGVTEVRVLVKVADDVEAEVTTLTENLKRFNLKGDELSAARARFKQLHGPFKAGRPKKNDAPRVGSQALAKKAGTTASSINSGARRLPRCAELNPAWSAQSPAPSLPRPIDSVAPSESRRAASQSKH